MRVLRCGINDSFDEMRVIPLQQAAVARAFMPHRQRSCGSCAMRLDDFDPNINVEDQRGQSSGSGFGWVWRGRWRRTAAWPVADGVQPLWVRRRGGAAGGPCSSSAAGFGMLGGGGGQLSSPNAQVGSATSRDRHQIELYAQRREQGRLQRLQFGRPDMGSVARIALRSTQAGLLRRRRPLGLRCGTKRDGTILLPARQRHLSRHQLLRRARHPLRCEGRFRAGLCNRPRIRPSHPEFARHVGSGRAGIQRNVAARPRAIRRR